MRSGGDSLRRAASALLVGLAAWGVVSHLWLAAGGVIPAWLMPLVLVIGGLAGAWPRGEAVGREDVPRWLLIAGASVLVAALVPVCWGAVATPDRDWDGFVSWSLRAKFLTPPVGLEQPFFAEPAVFAHGRGYPFLQPLTLGGLGALVGERASRLLFPVLWLLLATLVGTTLRRGGAGAVAAWTAAACAALTPMWLNPAAGAVDSGYAELFVAAALTAGGAGLMSGDARLATCAALLLPMLKPEGVPYGLALCIAAAFTGPPGLHLSASVALAAGTTCWLLLFPGGWPGPLVALAAGAGLLAASLLVRACVRIAGPRVAILALVLLGAAVPATAILAREQLFARGGPLGVHLVLGLEQLPSRATQLPQLAIGLLEQLTFVRKLGLLFVVLPALLLLPRRVAGPCPSRPLAAWLGMGLGAVLGALLLSPIADVAHELRSRFDRLLLQWVGVGWLLAGAWLLRQENRVPVATDLPGPRRGSEHGSAAPAGPR